MMANIVADAKPDPGTKMPPKTKYKLDDNAFVDIEHGILSGLVGKLITDDDRLGHFSKKWLWHHLPDYEAVSFNP